ncbi:MAG: AbrB/MazE/SpoVT family DNA-binding domain-containing protein [Clostridia bacterium]|nr:AbrB/MazE/SpoVT family DNA-binding domain-containing protein [Clostridia bacterium]
MYFAIKRCVDKLGRIVLPKDMRNHYGIKTGDALEIVATENGILLKIHSESSRKEN